MKMPLSRRGNTRRLGLLSSTTTIAGGVILAIVVLLVLVRLIAPGALDAIASPFWSFGANASGSLYGTSGFFADRAALVRERDALSAQNTALADKNLALTAQLTDLLRQLGTAAVPEKGIIAGVIARPPLAPYDMLVLGAGTNDGVALGHLVVANGGIPIGTVTSVSAHTAHVTLFSSAGINVAAWVGEQKLPLTLVGQGAGALAATLPRASGIASTSLVYMPGPGALPYAAIISIDSDPSAPRDILHLKPLVNPFTLTWVTVLPVSLTP